MSKYPHMTYLVYVSPKEDENDKTIFRFQSGRLITEDARNKCKSACTHRRFRTKNKLETFLRGLDFIGLNAIVHVLEIRPDGTRLVYEILLGKD